MMNKNKLIEILEELVKKSKDYNDGFLTPKDCKVKLSELNNYDFFIFNELEKTERELWTRSRNNIDNPETVYVNIIKIEYDYVSFIPRIIREYLKEIKQ